MNSRTSATLEAYGIIVPRFPRVSESPCSLRASRCSRCTGHIPSRIIVAVCSRPIRASPRLCSPSAIRKLYPALAKAFRSSSRSWRAGMSMKILLVKRDWRETDCRFLPESSDFPPKIDHPRETTLSLVAPLRLGG